VRPRFAMKALVLTYHSHNIAGATYGTNDHVALASDLRTLTRRGARIVPLDRIVESLHGGLRGDGLQAALTFDDGPSFDYADFEHRAFGLQRSFLNILRDFRAEAGAAAQPELHATSFVIASPDARRAMELADDCGYADIPGWLTDAWWNDAIDSGLMAVGNHSWDHVHRAVETLVASPEARDDFSRVETYDDADREIRQATAYIRSRTRGRCRYFAYPFGQMNRYLAEDYLPGHRAEHGMAAAFAVGGRAVAPDDSPWSIPRLVCGHHWRSPEALEALLRSSG
jgi:peptidoglycan/xylan/chitin deacetylase (PgdA/CDA1 family)